MSAKLPSYAAWAVPLAITYCLGLAIGGGITVAARRLAESQVYWPPFAGMAVGILVALAQSHPRRVLGLIPYGAAGLLVAHLGLALDVAPRTYVALLFFAVALAIGPAYLPFVAGTARYVGRYTLIGWFVTGFVSLPLGEAVVKHLPWPWSVWAIVAAAGFGTLLAFWWLYVHFLEHTAEVLLWPIYRVRAYGPGKWTFPWHGPVLVVSNHTAWFDPLWLGKVIPRHIVPMMGSAFYDLPVMRWVMVHLVGAIRVQESGFRRDVPELDEVVAALDRGECVVIFPEGRVRRKEEQPLRPFGQGVWHILQRRPETPVVVCWIEGGWGSFFSYKGGRPMTNKPFDKWWPIHVGMDEPRVLDAEVLQEHRATRQYLREACRQARRHVGLEPHELGPPGGKADDEADDTP